MCRCAWNLYSYSDSEYEYRHVQLPKKMLSKIPHEYFDHEKGTLKILWEEEWRGLGIEQVREREREGPRDKDTHWHLVLDFRFFRFDDVRSCG